jgi:hypothetical protein
MRSTDEVSISKGGVLNYLEQLVVYVKDFNMPKVNLNKDFEFTNLSMKLGTDKVILSGVTGRVAPGKVTARYVYVLDTANQHMLNV